MVGRVRIDLRFEGESVALAVDPTALADDGAIEEVARIELDAGRGRRHFHHPAGAGILKPEHGAQRAGRPVDDVVMVVAAADPYLLVASVADPRADRRGRAEVERRSGDRPDLAGRDQSRVDRRVGRGVEREPRVHRIARRALARQVEQGMVGDVDDGRPVAGGSIGNGQRIVFRQRIGRGDIGVPG
jgi:hypothetical protein